VNSSTSAILFDSDATEDERLESLGLSRQIIYDAVLVGEAARASCTANDPPILPGLLSWGRTLRGLGELLAPRGWVRRDEGNFSTVVDKRLGIAIAVATGDEATGLLGATPRTKYPKGPTTERAVEQNNQQLRLFDEPDDVETDEAIDQGVSLTWILLIARIGADVRCELSLPAALGEDGRVEAWRERIILGPIRVSQTTPAFADLELTEEIDIPVTARTEV